MLIILIIGTIVLLAGAYVVLLNGVNALQQARGTQGADGGLSPATRSDGPAPPLGPVQPPFSVPPPPTTGPAAHPSSAVSLLSGGATDAAFAS